LFACLKKYYNMYREKEFKMWCGGGRGDKVVQPYVIMQSKDDEDDEDDEKIPLLWLLFIQSNMSFIHDLLTKKEVISYWRIERGRDSLLLVIHLHSGGGFLVFSHRNE
jgi:hypothetical protein